MNTLTCKPVVTLLSHSTMSLGGMACSAREPQARHSSSMYYPNFATQTSLYPCDPDLDQLPQLYQGADETRRLSPLRHPSQNRTGQSFFQCHFLMVPCRWNEPIVQNYFLFRLHRFRLHSMAASQVWSGQPRNHISCAAAHLQEPQAGLIHQCHPT